MGIPGFFAWLRKNVPFIIAKTQERKINFGKPVDVLCLDMNGIFHEACQKVYKYGNYAVLKSKIHPEPPPLPEKVMRKRVFAEIGRMVDELVHRVRPRKTLLIMIDGPAGMAKQSQQRQRRYRNKPGEEFDSNCISPGTEWMDYLSKYLDYLIRVRITESRAWQKLQVIFSSEKVPGEGEHKLIRYIRKHPDPTLTYVMYGLDADLIMLCLSVQNRMSQGLEAPQFFILRDDNYDHNPETKFLVNINLFRRYLYENLCWGLDCSPKHLINDFVFLCFMLGNDFLPHFPSIDLIEGGVELLFGAYTETCTQFEEHLITEKGEINLRVLKGVLSRINRNEQARLILSVQSDKFADPLIQKHLLVKPEHLPESSDPRESRRLKAQAREEREEVEEKENDSEVLGTLFDFEAYRKEYYTTKLRAPPLRVCHDYLRGLEWVYKYYTEGIPSWTWSYPHFYAPFTTELIESIDTYRSQPFELGRPMFPLQQLLSILAPHSKNLLPEFLHPIIEKFESDFTIDLAGKKLEWQAIVIVPKLPDFEAEYRRLLAQTDSLAKKRNILGKEFIYTHDPSKRYPYKCYQGEFESDCQVRVFE
jgi:5'-3' exonuclease